MFFRQFRGPQICIRHFARVRLFYLNIASSEAHWGLFGNLETCLVYLDSTMSKNGHYVDELLQKIFLQL
jgi:hypothetical protein